MSLKKIIGLTSALIFLGSIQTYSTSKEIRIKDEFASLSEFANLMEAENEIKEIKIDEEKFIKKYIFKIKEKEEKFDVIEVFENGRGIYINGKYIPFDFEEINGFKAPKVKNMKIEDEEIKIPAEIFEEYLGGVILDGKKIAIDKNFDIEIGTLGEYNNIENLEGLVIDKEKESEKVQEQEIEKNDNNNQTEDATVNVQKPEQSKPEISKPKPSIPEVEKPKPIKPEVPKPPKPEVEKPNPEVKPEEPEIENPKPEIEPEKPEIENPEITKPDVSEPKPEIQEPEIDKPEVQLPEEIITQTI